MASLQTRMSGRWWLVGAGLGVALLATGCRGTRVLPRQDPSAWNPTWWGSDRQVQSGQPELGSTPERNRSR